MDDYPTFPTDRLREHLVPVPETPLWVQKVVAHFEEADNRRFVQPIGAGHTDDGGWFITTFENGTRTKSSHLLAVENPATFDLSDTYNFDGLRPLLYVDMDGVLADYDAKAKTLYNAYDGDRDPDDFTWHKILPHFFLTLPVVDGAVEAFDRLDKKYDTYILSRPSWDNPHCWTDKRRWVEDRLETDIEDRLILSHNKSLLRGDILVDDREKHGDGFDDFIHFGSDQWPDWDAVLEYLL